MRAPFDLQFQVVRRNATLTFFISHSRIDSLIHPHDDLIGGQAALWVERPAELAIDHFADSFQHTTHQTLRQNRVALWLGA